MPRDPPVMLLVSPSMVTILDVPPYNNYTLTCSAVLPASFTLLNISLLWYDVLNGQLLNPNTSVTINNFSPIQMNNGVLFLSVLVIREMSLGMATRGCRAVVSLLHVVNETVLSSRPVTNLVSTATVTVHGQISPYPVSLNSTALFALSSTIAVIQFFVPLIAYTPEKYRVEYHVIDPEVFNVKYSDILVGNSNITSSNTYTIILPNLQPNTEYNFTITSTNNNFDTVVYSMSQTFRTSQSDIYILIDDVLTIPTGALVSVSLGRLTVSSHSTFSWFSLNDSMLQPVIFPPEYNRTTNILDLNLFIADVSRTGSYIVCVNLEGPLYTCGESFDVVITVPTLAISTNLLILQYNGNVIVPGMNREVLCTPSDPEAPIRWRSSDTMFPMLPSDLGATLTEMGQMLTFPKTFEVNPPDHTIHLICDLQGSNVKGDAISPRSVLIRFLQSPVSILNRDHETSTPDAVINFFSTVESTRQLVLSLVCLSVYPNNNLVWERVSSSNSQIEPITSTIDGVIDVSYDNDDSEHRLTELFISPFTAEHSGTYICRSNQSNNTDSVYLTTRNPLFELESPGMEYYPLGAEVSSLTVRYGDRSVGYTQMGRGFNYTLIFLPCVETLPQGVLIPHSITNRFQTSVTYPFQARLNLDSGEYLWNATHIDSGSKFVVSKNLTIIRPNFVVYDSTVFTLPRVNVTLRCIPNDTRAPVIWSNIQFELEDLRAVPQSYLLSPPGLDHLLTFNSSVVFGLTPVNSQIQLRSTFSCGFIDGRSSVPRIFTTLTLQGARIEVRNIGRFDFPVLNNSIINSFEIPSRKRREASRDYVYESPPEGQYLGTLRLNCNGVQGDHNVSWYTDNPLVRLSDGRVNCDSERLNHQDLLSNYSSRLVLGNLHSGVTGNYICRSSISSMQVRVEIITENPYIRRLTPAIITVNSGDSVMLGFQVAVNSFGSGQSRASFGFNNTEGIISTKTFRVSNVNQPHNHYLNIPSVQEADSGIYFTTALNEQCDPEYDEVNCAPAVTVEITLIVISYCNQEVRDGFLWPRTSENSVVSLSCDQAGDSFRTETKATRQCLSGGTWSEPILATCTLKQDVDPFLLIWFVLEVGEAPDEEGKTILEEEMRQELKQFNVMVSSVRLQSAITASISLSFEVTLSNPVSEQSEALTAYRNYLSSQFQNFSGVEVRESNRGLIGVSSAASCPCSSGNSSPSNSSNLELCAGAPTSPCNCTNSICQCMPPFVGDGDYCTLDTDDDTFPDHPLQSPSCSDSSASNSNNYCSQDNCKLISNEDQDPMACESPEAVRINNPDFNGCLLEVDQTWQVLWPNTPRGSISSQQCPGGLESNGKATRECSSSGIWQEPNVLGCESIQFAIIRNQAMRAFSSSDPQTLVAEVAIITEELVRVTATPVAQSSTPSLLPFDLQTTVNLLTDIVSILNDYDVSSDTTENVINIFNNVLHLNNSIGWNALAQSQTLNGSELLLYTAERYGLSLARSQLSNGSPLRLSRTNIVISASVINQSKQVSESDLQFPVREDLVNFSSNIIPVVSRVPLDYINNLLETSNDNTSVPVSHIIFMNLNEYLQPSTLKSNVTRVGSIIYSIQLGDRSLSNNKPLELGNSPLSLEFTFDLHENVTGYNCTFWEFSEPIGKGGFSKDGVTTESNATKDNLTSVYCLSNHLTSFAVLVDVAGVIPHPGERLALQVVSYIGCAVSIVCLTLSVIFFIFQRKKLFTSLNYFVHLNLSLSLLMAFIVFVLGIELGTSTKGGCLFVALLLHYLFLSAFCWMLCEGIVLYFLLVAIFNQRANKWWLYMLIGYVAPLPVIIISVASRYDNYGVTSPDGELIYCWLSVEQGTIFAFVAPMLVIIIINIIFLALGLQSFWKNRKRRAAKAKKTNDTGERIKSLIVASLVLLPLLGLTWAFGILTINANATVFAWLFTIFNSFQGLAIFFFHVVRNDKIWSKITFISGRSTKRISSSSRAMWYSQTSGQTTRGVYKSKDPSSGYNLNTLNGGDGTLNKTDMTAINMDEEKQDLSTMNSMTSSDDRVISNDYTAFPEYKLEKSKSGSKQQCDVHDSVVISNSDAVSTSIQDGTGNSGTATTNQDAAAAVISSRKNSSDGNTGRAEQASSNGDSIDNLSVKSDDKKVSTTDATDDDIEDERISKL